MPKLILDLCGGTGAWSRPYAEAGYEVVNVTLPEYDVRFYRPQHKQLVHGILAAPPCTEFAASGARWWKDKPPHLLQEAVYLVKHCIWLINVLKPTWWCLENPVGRLPRWLGPPVMYFHPYEYGDPWTKKTALWGRFEPPIKTPVEPTRKGYIHRLPASKNRAVLRSVTPPGFARAFFLANP